MIRAAWLTVLMSATILLTGRSAWCQEIEPIPSEEQATNREEIEQILASLRPKVWTYRELAAAADTIVVATLKTRETGRADLYHGETQHDVVLSTFDVSAVFRGDVALETLEIVHFGPRPDVIYLYDFRMAGFQTWAYRPGTRLVRVEMGEKPTPFNPADTKTYQPEYLIFLKRRDDGRYALATGVNDEESSVQILKRPESDLTEFFERQRGVRGEQAPATP